MAHIARLIAFAVFSLCCQAAQAYGTVNKETQVIWTCGGASGGAGISPESACSGQHSAWMQYWIANKCVTCTLTPIDPYKCGDPGSSSNTSCSARILVTGYGYVQGNWSATKSTQVLCPVNSSEVGSKCECTQGFKSVPGNTCQPYSCPAAGAYTAQTTPDIQQQSVGNVCTGGCEYRPSSWKTGADGRIWATWPFRSTSSFCGGAVGTDGIKTGSDNAPPAPVPCGDGQCPGSVNGVNVCVPCKGQAAPPSSSAASGVQPGDPPPNPDDPNSGIKSSETKTECIGGTCTVTTLYKDGNGNVIGERRDDKPRESFCAENPQLQICKNTAWGGSCDGGFSCDGDAVQCALSREIHRRNCELSQPSELSDVGLSIMDGSAVPVGHPGASPGTIDAGALFRPADAGGGACLADRQLSLMGRPLVIPFSSMCDPLRWMGHIAFALALVHAAFFLMRRV